MATFSDGELSNPRRLEQSFARLPQRYRAAFLELLRRMDEPINTAKPPRRRRERINDAQRGARMLQLIADGLLDYPAARQACIEDPGAAAANDDRCMRRLVRKYRDGKFSR